MTYKKYIESLLNVLSFSTRNIDVKILPELVNEAYIIIMTEIEPMWIWEEYIRKDNSSFRKKNLSQEREYTVIRNMYAVDDNGNYIKNFDKVCSGSMCEYTCCSIYVLKSVMYPIESCDISTLMKIRECIKKKVKMDVFESTASQKGADRQSIATNMYAQELSKLKDMTPEFKWEYQGRTPTGIEYKL